MSEASKKPKKEALLPEEITARFLRSIQNQFYKDQGNFFHQEKSLLLQAIAYPARWLDDRSVAVSADRYIAMLTEIIRIINAHGNLARIHSPGRYLLSAVQKHMLHHGEEYYEIGKATRNAFADAMAGLKPRADNAEKTADLTVSTLAQTHRVLSGAKPGRKKSQEQPEQGSLF